MNQNSNRLWIFAFPLSLALLVAALYVKKPGVRDFVDRQCPWVKASVGKYAPPFEVRILGSEPTSPAGDEKVAPPAAPAPRQATTSASSSPAPSVMPVPQQGAAISTAAPDSFDLDKVCADPARWPKVVRLKGPVDFPAVLDGKVVGKLRAPAGAETRVVKISHGQLGVEFRGGGAWLAFENTDFVERARIAWR